MIRPISPAAHPSGAADEIVLILAVRGPVCLWRFTPPPRALVARAVAPVSLTLSGEGLRAMLALSPGRIGQSSVEIVIHDDAGEPLSPKSVRVSFEPDSGAIAPIVRSADVRPDGTWYLDAVNLPIAGSWLVEVEMRVSDFELARVAAPVQVDP